MMIDPNKLTRRLGVETADMSDRDAMLVRKGAGIALVVVMGEWKAFYSFLDNSRPDLIATTPTVRR